MSGRLRSLHLPSETSPQAIAGGTNPADNPAEDSKYLPRNGVIPIGVRTIVLLGIFLSLFFIGAISASFAGAGEDADYLNVVLRDVAQTDLGVRLCGLRSWGVADFAFRLCSWAKMLMSMLTSPLSLSAGQFWHAGRLTYCLDQKVFTEINSVDYLPVHYTYLSISK
jgi:hypothetical protein